MLTESENLHYYRIFETKRETTFKIRLYIQIKEILNR
jgi:hypothetical protein